QTHYLIRLYAGFKTTRVGAALATERGRCVLAWAAVALGVLLCLIGGWLAQRDPRRADGNRGHVSLDFSGQWLMGRMLVSGQGRCLYERDYQRQALEAAYPAEDGNPELDSDAEAIMTAMI